jgi:L-ascorbate metabolism protein UlaG (beta-lactamase superfamily)
MRRSAAWVGATVLWTLATATFAEAACREMDVARGRRNVAYAGEVDAVIQYFGHNFFLVTTRKGTKIATDPLAPGMYPTPNVSAHVVTVGREHPNHNYVQIIQGTPLILRGLNHFGADWNRVSTSVRDVFIYNLPIYQSAVDGALKGAAFIFDLGTLCVAHLGDLSHLLTADQIKQIGKVDVALIPIGGIFTMPAGTAREVLKQIKPKIAIPMHYRDNSFILQAFTQGLPTRAPESDTLAVSKDALPKGTEIVVLRPRGGWDYR